LYGGKELRYRKKNTAVEKIGFPDEKPGIRGRTSIPVRLA
jgi:hypothetical protein